VTDTFARDNLPPPELWPDIDLGDLGYPARLNCAVELVDRMAARHSERPALWFEQGGWSYGELLARVDRIARVLVEDHGLVPGNRVMLRGFNTPMMVASWLAVAKAGGVVVATMPLLRAGELSYMIAKARIGLCLCQSNLLDEAKLAQAQSPLLTRIVPFSADGDGGDELDRAMAAKPADFTAADTAADEPVLIAFTSGTTGRAKGTVHAHRDMLAVCDTFGRHIAQVRQDDVFVGTPPVAFTFGLGALVLFPLRFGASSVLVERFGPTTLLETIAAHRATAVYTAPTAYRALAPLAGDYDLSCLRTCVSAGEHLPRATWELWREATGISIINGIGSTEMLHIFIAAAGHDIRPGSTGVAVPGYQAAILDQDGALAPPGEEGWLAVKGPTGCRYLDDAERQRGYLRRGWNITGDIYRQDEDGYFWFVARGDDMIVSAGYNISGPEVEDALLGHPEVAECAVIGVPDSERGQIVAAYVVPVQGTTGSERLAAELQSHVKRTIAPYKYPRVIHFRDALPRTPTGKLQRFRLRDEGSRAKSDGLA
jgi:2-aminobenzoate-CoA ligase